MQNVTPTADHVALNAAPTVKPRFGTYEVNWEKVTSPAGNSLVSRVAHAFVEAVKNIAKSLYNAAVWLPNKIHSVLYPNAANTVQAPANEDDVVIQDSSVIVSLYDNEETDQIEESGIPQPIIEIEEDLPEAVASNGSWVKAGVIGGLVLGGTAAGLVLASRYDVKVPYFGWDIPGAKGTDSFLTQTIPGKFNDVKDYMSAKWANFRMPSCDQAKIDAWKQDAAYTGAACAAGAKECTVDGLKAAFLAAKAAAETPACKV